MNFPSWYNAQMHPLKHRYALKSHRHTEIQRLNVLDGLDIQIQYTAAMNIVCSSSCFERELVRISIVRLDVLKL
jgi:hypothetical protein